VIVVLLPSRWANQPSGVCPLVAGEPPTVGYEAISTALVAPDGWTPPPVATVPAGQLAVADGSPPVAVAVATVVEAAGFCTITDHFVGDELGTFPVVAEIAMYAEPL
jgi:hypothetical protein